MILEIPIEASPVADVAKMVCEMAEIEYRDAHNFVTGIVCALGKDAFDCYDDGEALRIVPSDLMMALVHKNFMRMN